MTDIVEIRWAQNEDLDRVAQIWHASAIAADGAPPEMASVVDLRARIDAELADTWTLSVASVGGEIAGMLAVRLAERVLDQLYISPPTQRRGIGTRLLRRAMEGMPAGFTLRTASANTSARAFYERMGLKLLSEGEHPRLGLPVCFYGWNVS